MSKVFYVCIFSYTILQREEEGRVVFGWRSDGCFFSGLFYCIVGMSGEWCNGNIHDSGSCDSGFESRLSDGLLG